MKLTYRGIEYDYNPPVAELDKTSEVGKYRGVDIRFRTIKKAPVQQSTVDLMYRGVAYRTGEVTAPVPVVTATAPAVATTAAVSTGLEERARTMLMGHHRNVKRRQQAMMGRLAAEVGLAVDDATHYWNHIQGKVHPSFWATYDRSRSASS
ncbi:DUF4278 domain-containing protein [Leptolyngbya sp. PCC 6406]|uniref:DUF4278 domain-containing protein n=1 Tax=Leptolyngbya sp. PCC 6406 TaxID=1173264 RepID=UPI0002ABF014|nr:DUF4278 domain-containing protein [Leptolyngbya sp. PCC 6406]